MAKKNKELSKNTGSNISSLSGEPDWKETLRKKYSQLSAQPLAVSSDEAVFVMPTSKPQVFVVPESVDPGMDAENPAVALTQNPLKPQRTTKAAGLSAALQINRQLVTTTPGKKQAIVLTERYKKEPEKLEEHYRNYAPKDKPFATAPVKDLPKFVITTPLFPDPMTVASIEQKNAPDDPESKETQTGIAPIAIFDDPRQQDGSVRTDLLSEKAKLEARFFGKDFPDDNIHIQLIHNILDIDKILAPYINGISVTLNRMNPEVTHFDDPAAEPEEDNENDSENPGDAAGNLQGLEKDFIGNFYLGNSYSVFSDITHDQSCEKFTTESSKPDQIERDWTKLLTQRKQVNALFQYPRMSYFGDVLYSQELKDSIKKHRKNIEEYKLSSKYKEDEREQRKLLYYALWLIAFTRMSLAHSKDLRDILFLLDKAPNDCDWEAFIKCFKDHDTQKALKEVREILDNIYGNKIKSINKTFLKNAQANLAIIALALDEEISQKLVNEYYAFAERKEHRNTGYSIRMIRELLVKKNIGGNSHDVIYAAFHNSEENLSRERQKLNTVLDFLLWRCFTEDAEKDENGLPISHSAAEEEFISRLRGTSLPKNNYKLGNVGDVLFFTPEEDQKWLSAQIRKNSTENPEKIERLCKLILAKRDIYCERAACIWDEICEKVKIAVKNIQPDCLKGFKGEAHRIPFTLVEKDEGQAHYFSKLMYLLTLFLDGKDINIMLTQLANKFDNIAGFLELLSDLQEKNLITTEQNPPFVSAYRFFLDSREIASELRVVNSVAHMTKGNKVDAMRDLYVDAVLLLGWDGDSASLDAYIDDFLSSKRVDAYAKQSQGGTLEEQKKAEKIFYSTGYRNFIVSNVIDNRRFRYLIRYGNPGELKKIVKNEALVQFVLNRMPPEQIKKYYQSYTGNDPRQHKEMVAFLTEKLASFNAETFKDVRTSNKASASEHIEAEKQKALISLYLSVLYQVVKNLININYRYFLAFHMVERDGELQGIHISKDYSDITREAIKKSAVTKSGKRFQKYLRSIDSRAAKNAINKFRNDVEHINIIRSLCENCDNIGQIKSFYGLYHLLMQLWIRKQLKPTDQFRKEYLDGLGNTFCPNAVKVLCYPFGYNLSRYKNLSIEALFDMNDTEKNHAEQKKPDDSEVLPKAVVPEGTLYFHTTKPERISEKVTPTKKTTFYYKNRRYCGSLIRLSTGAEAAKNKKGIRPKVFALDLAKMPQGCPFYTDDDGAWYVQEIPADALAPCTAMAAT